MRTCLPALACCLALAAPSVARAQILPLTAVEQEQTMWCWAGTSRAILLFYGRDVAECALANDRYHASPYTAGYDCCADPLPCNDGYDGVPFLLMKEGAAATERWHALSLEETRAELGAGQPFFIRWEWTGGFAGHWLVGHGLDQLDLYYLDPWMGEGLKIALYDWVVKSDEHTWIETTVTSRGCLGAADGTPCDDSSLCTGPDTCLHERCSGPDRVTCPAPPPCLALTCLPATGSCIPIALDGPSCDDHDLCTLNDRCVRGACQPADQVVCPEPGPCEWSQGCDAATGTCLPPVPKTDGTACDDGSACTLGDSCHSGRCTGSPIECGTFECHVSAGCTPATGRCQWARAAEGTPCAGGSCAAGACVKAGPDAGQDPAPKPAAKGCASAPGATWWWLALLALLTFARRASRAR